MFLMQVKIILKRAIIFFKLMLHYFELLHFAENIFFVANIADPDVTPQFGFLIYLLSCVGC